MAAPPPVLTVVVEKGPRAGETRQCRAGSALRVGRVVKGNDLAVRDAGASQQHLAFQFLPPPAAAVWAVSDLGSSNGTFLNGVPLVPSVPSPLSHGDLIKVGDSTVLAVSIAPDSDPNPNPVANPSQRRSSRRAAAVGPVVEEEKPSVVTRRGTRKKAPQAAEPPRVEKEEQDAAAVVVVDERPQVVTRRGGRKKLVEEGPLGDREDTAEAPRLEEQKKAEEPSEPENDDEEKEEATVVTCRGLRKKAVETPKPEKEEPTVVTLRGLRKKAVETPKPEEEEATVVTRRNLRKKAIETPEPAKEEAPVVTRRGGRKKNEVMVAPLPLPPRTRSTRGRGTKDSARNTVLEDAREQQGGNELAASRAQPASPLASTAVNCDKEQKRDKVAAWDGQVEVIAEALEEKVPKRRVCAQYAASDNCTNGAAAEPSEGMAEFAEATCRGRRNKAIEPHEPEREKEEANVVSRRGRQKKVVEAPEPEKEEKEVLVVTHRGGRKKNEATVAPMPLPSKRRPRRVQRSVTSSSAMKTVLDDDEVVQGGNELAASRTRTGNTLTSMTTKGGEEQKGDKAAAGHGGVGGTVKTLEEEVSKGKASAKLAASNNGAYAAVAELTEEIELAAEAPRRGRRKRTVEPPVREKEEMDAISSTRHDGQKKAAVVTRRVGRKKDAVIVAPPPLPPKMRSEKGQGRVTRASARNNVLEEEDKVEPEENGVAAAREQAGNPSIGTSVHGGEDKEVKGSTDALEDEASKGRASAQHASSDNRGEEEQGGAHRSSRDDSGSNGIPNTTSKYREDRKLKAYSTPFDIRLDRALKKYSA